MPGFGLNPKLHAYRFEYDSTLDAKVQGDVTLRGTPIPTDAVIVAGYVDVERAVTSGGAATVALKLNAAADVLAATAKATLAAAALLATVPVFATPATAVRVAGTAKSVVATIAAADLTDGKFHVHLFGFVR